MIPFLLEIIKTTGMCMKNFSLAVVALAFALPTFAQNKDVVATVNGRSITKKQFEEFVRQLTHEEKQELILKNNEKNIERDDQNLIIGLDYPFDENGKINWRKLIKNEYLVPNKDRTQETAVS